MANLKGELLDVSKKFKKIEDTLNGFIFERKEEVHGLNLAVLSGVNMLCLGSPGIAKSYMIDNYKEFIYDHKFFKIQLTKFSTPEEVFGPFSIPDLKDGKFKRITQNKMPEADFVFMDEIFKANSGILNTLLLAINEREFINDGVSYKIPMLALVAASNEVPDEQDGLEAMFDRMVLKYVSQPIHETSNFIKMLQIETPAIDPIISLQEIYNAREFIKSIALPQDAEDVFCRIRDGLRKENLAVTDRTYKNCVKILKAQAYLSGRDTIVKDDFDVLQHALWTDVDTKKKVYTVILDLINPIKFKILSLLGEAEEIVDKLDKAEDETKVMMNVVEATKKIKSITSQITKHIKEAEDLGRNVSEMHDLLKVAEAHMSKCMSYMGVDMKKLVK